MLFMYHFMWRWLKQRIVDFDLRGSGPYNGLSSYVAMAPTMIDFCTVIEGCFFLFFFFSMYVLFLSFQVILSCNSWKGIQQFSSINVYEVLEVMLKSRADTTTKAYVRVIRKFLEWSKGRHFNMQLPFPLSVVSLYLFEVQQSCTSSSSVILAHAALKWLHSFVPSLDRNPLDSEFCRNIIESAKRQKSQPVMKKKPITTEIIRSILDIHNKKDANLKNLRIAALCSLAFAGFFRYDELCNIVPKHIEFHSDYIRIFVPRSKTDVYREGNFVFISASRSKYCPVGVLQRYLDLSGIDLCSSLPLFRPLVFHRSSSSYTLRSGKISYTTCRDILRDTLSQLGLNPNDYGLHSLRSGGITSAVRNSSNSIPERLLKIHGRWKSDSAKDMYVEESLCLYYGNLRVKWLTFV